MKALLIFCVSVCVISLIPASAIAFIPYNMQKHIEIEANYGWYFQNSGHTNFYGEQYSLKVDPWMYLGLSGGWRYSKKGLLGLNTMTPLKNFSDSDGAIINFDGEILQPVWEENQFILFLKGVFEWEEVMGKVNGKFSENENYSEYQKFSPFLGKVMVEGQFTDNFFMGIGFAVKRHNSPMVFTNISGDADAPVIYSALVPESVVYAYDFAVDVKYANYATWLFYNISASGYVGPGFGDPNTEAMNDWRGFMFSAIGKAKAECGVQLFKAYPTRGVITLGISLNYEYLGTGAGGEVITDPSGNVVKFKRGADLTWATMTTRIYGGFNFTF